MPVHLYDDRHFATVPSGDEPRLMVLCAFPHRLIYQKLWIVAKCQHAKMGGHHFVVHATFNSQCRLCRLF